MATTGVSDIRLGGESGRAIKIQPEPNFSVIWSAGLRRSCQGGQMAVWKAGSRVGECPGCRSGLILAILLKKWPFLAKIL